MTRWIVWAFAVALWVLAIPPVLSALIPASLWFEVERVEFQDSKEGAPPTITVARSINRPFRGSWEAEVLRSEGAIFVPTDCKRKSPIPFDYKPGRTIPPGADLRWWLEIPPNPDCEWLPGRYLVNTTWRIYLWAGVTLKVRNTSNIFTIRAAA